MYLVPFVPQTYAPSGAPVPFTVAPYLTQAQWDALTPAQQSLIVAEVRSASTATAISPFWAAASTLSAGLGAYHGYKRNQSVGWALWWALMGGIAPIITPAIAVAQGFGERKKG